MCHLATMKAASTSVLINEAERLTKRTHKGRLRKVVHEYSYTMLLYYRYAGSHMFFGRLAHKKTTLCREHLWCALQPPKA